MSSKLWQSESRIPASESKNRLPRPRTTARGRTEEVAERELLQLILLLRASRGDEREVARAQLQPDLLFFVLVGPFDEDVLEGALLSRPLGAVATAARRAG